ncbi:MAG: hypothetical protein AB2792_13750 [Candidatus Thiodiazotropha sp.]
MTISPAQQRYHSCSLGLPDENRIIAFFSGFVFPEYFAKDFKSENHPGLYAHFFWILYLIACALIVFDWQLY